MTGAATARDDTARKDTARDDTARKDTARKDTARAGTARKDTARAAAAMLSEDAAMLSEDAAMLSERVYRSIIRLVMRGELRRGSALRIGELARALGVSPTPVREGLTRLEATGLVVHAPRRGFRVAPPLTAGQFERLMDARELLEVGAAGLALAAGELDFARALGSALRAQEAAVDAFRHGARTGAGQEHDAAWAVVEADLAFHRVIFEFTGNPFVKIMADSLNGQAHRVRQTADQGIRDDLEAVTEHAAIVRAARSGDRAAVESAMRLHLRLVRARARQEIA